MRDTILAAALEYAARGWHVLPLAPGCKTPPLLPEGPRAATTDPAIIRAWWQRWPQANVAIATGPGSGLVVIDVDPGNGGDASWAVLEARGIPSTLRAHTPSGGWHLYFRHPGIKVWNSQSLIGPGIDVRGDSGYLTAPPSIIAATGRGYSWADAAEPLAELPPMLFARIWGISEADAERLLESVRDSEGGRQ